MGPARKHAQPLPEEHEAALGLQPPCRSVGRKEVEERLALF